LQVRFLPGVLGGMLNMASVTNNQDEKSMAADAIAPGADEPGEDKPRERAAKPSSPSGGGFFTIYKHGQGYWTRLCTTLGAAAVLLMTTNFIWSNVPPYLRPALTPLNPTSAQISAADGKTRHITMAICAGFLVLSTILVWKIINSPTNADFLIATDSEMKKVNWTSRKELIGSTKVVVFFMIIIATVLFLVDVFFGYLFYFLHVLKSPPF
jgi:preprotein translocase subunit SecE